MPNDEPVTERQALAWLAWCGVLRKRADELAFLDEESAELLVAAAGRLERLMDDYAPATP